MYVGAWLLLAAQSSLVDGVWSVANRYPVAAAKVARDSAWALPSEAPGIKFSRLQAKVRVEEGQTFGFIPSSVAANGPRYVIGIQPGAKNVVIYEMPWQGTVWKNISAPTLAYGKESLIDVSLVQLSSTRSRLKIKVDGGAEQNVDLPSTLAAFQEPAAFAYDSKGSLTSFTAFIKRGPLDRQELPMALLPSKLPSYVPNGLTLESEPGFSNFATIVKAELEKSRAKFNLPGATCAVVVDDKIVCSAATGVRRVGSPTLVTLNDLFHLGSNTKSMTATLLGKYVDAGRIRFSDTLAVLLPDLESAMHPSTKQITLFNLLHASSGIPGDTSYPDYAGTSLMALRTEAVRKAVGKAPTFAQGTQFQYQNMNFVIAGAILDRLSAEPWEQSIKKRLFQPIGANWVGYGPMGLPGTLLGPYGHRFVNQAYEPAWADNQGWGNPAGGLQMTVTDFARFARLHLRAEMGYPTLLTGPTFKTLHTPHNGYGMGWAVGGPYPTGEYDLSHGGSNTLNSADMFIRPVRGVAVVAMTNASPYDGGKGGEFINDFMSRMYDVVIPQQLGR